MLRGSRFSRDSGDLKTPFLAGKERELLESKKWPACFSKSVDITKVQIDAFKPWITRRVTELMGVEDEIVVDYCLSQLKFFGETDAKANAENAGDGGRCLNEKPYLDPKKLQINLTGFMAKNARIFVKELWDLLLAAQDSEYGIPQVFIDEKKREIAAIQGAANEVEDTLRQMGSSLPASNHTERDSNSFAEGSVQNTNEPSSAAGVGGEAESGPSEHREAHRQSLQSKRGAGRSWYETRQRANRRAKYPARRHDDSIRDHGHRRRRSPSSGSSRSSSESVSYRRRTHRRRSPSRSSSVSYSNRSGSSSSRSSSAVRRAPRHGRRRSYSSVSSDSPSPSESSLDSRASRSVDSSVSRRSRGKRYESRRSRDRSVSHRRRRSSDSYSSRSSYRSSRSSSSSSSYRTRRRRGSGRRYRSRDRRSYS